MDIKKEYERWLENATADANVAAELKTLDNAKIEDAFYRDLAFGTGGLRGVIGAGTNRMNIYTVAKASQGLADYLKKNFAEPSVAIGYDSRIKSDVFAKVAAGVFAANGVKVNIWPVLMPVPTVSFATRYLHTSAGVMVTASHNPSKYNGYKVYGADGLSKLEYRGYDSAGLAVRDGEALAQVVRAKGRLSNLIEKTDAGNALKGTCGIGHAVYRF